MEKIKLNFKWIGDLGFGIRTLGLYFLSSVVSAAGTPAPAMPGINVPAIKVNTVGYPAGWTKIAVFNIDPVNAALYNEAGDIVMKLDDFTIRRMGIDAASNDPVWQVGFSGFTTPGRYYFKSGKEKSDVFEIGKDIFGQALKASLKNFYYQRCRTKLEEPFTLWGADDVSYVREEACHSQADFGFSLDAYPDKKNRLEQVRGWHDAGNYDMYIPSTAPTVQLLLRAFELNPSVFPDNHCDIPESGNGISDLLDEARWGLDWMLSMQVESGALRARSAVMQQGEGHGAPAHKDKASQWVSGIGSVSTAKACAAFAQAARVYKNVDEDLSRQYATAAQKAWAWLQKHPQRVFYDTKGSNQPTWDDSTEYKETGARAAAAMQMWLTFRNKQALEQVETLLDTPEMKAEQLRTGAWANLSRWVVMDLAEDSKAPVQLRDMARDRLFEAADIWQKRVNYTDGYRCATETPGGYYWGSNSNLMEKVELLMCVYRLDSKNYGWAKQAARDQWHWILGRNPNGYSMVTRVGKGPERFYHTEFLDSAVPPPGYLVNGPNFSSSPFLAPQAPAKAMLWDNPTPLRSGLPAHSLWHNQQSDLWDGGFVAENQWDNGWWTVVECDIYYNANLTLVAALMQD